MTRASASISRSFASTSSPYIPFMTRSSRTTSGLVDEIAFERGHAVFGLDDLVAGAFEDAARPPPGKAGVVDDENPAS